MRRIDSQFKVVDKDGNLVEKFTLFSAMHSNHFTLENTHGVIHDGSYNGYKVYEDCLKHNKQLCSLLNNGYQVIEIK